jgi:hypothetical protein
MRFVADGPDLPEALLFAHEEGRLIFFCGAGISRPAGLPLFDGLVERLYTSLRESRYPTEETAWNEKRYDTVVALLEERIGSRQRVRKHVHQILSNFDLTAAETTATHRALLTLARSDSEHRSAGRVRLVTTNFDRLFVAADASVHRYCAPFLPVPRPTRWNGVVYLHGLMPESPDAADADSANLDSLVLASGDFGTAYLTERWASRFVSELFRNFMVCFVGYGLTDPIVRYVVDALAADRLRGENRVEVYAFAGHPTGQREKTVQDWAEKFVTAIPYTDDDNHRGLHGTLLRWSEVYRDGLQGRRGIVLSEAHIKPTDPDHVARVIWALSEPTGDAARTFAEMNPTPPIEWLQEFSKPRFGHQDLQRFGCDERALPLPGPQTLPDQERSFSLLHRPHPAGTMPWLSLVGNFPGAHGLDPITGHLCAWLCRHLDKSETVSWVARARGQLHPWFAFQVRRALDQSRELNEFTRNI